MNKFIITITTQLEVFNIIGINEDVLYYVIKAYYNEDSQLKLGGKTYNLRIIHEFTIHEFESENLLDDFINYVEINKLKKKSITGTAYFETSLIEIYAKNVSLDYLKIDREKNIKNEQQSEELNEENKEILNGINQLIERLPKLEMGQEIIYDDLKNDIEEVKSLIGKTSKKNIRQLIIGKLVDAGLGTIAEKTLDAIQESATILLNK